MRVHTTRAELCSCHVKNDAFLLAINVFLLLLVNQNKILRDKGGLSVSHHMKI